MQVNKIKIDKNNAPIILRVFNRIVRQTRAERRRANLSLLEKDPNAKLLDCGCNDGEFTMRVAETIGTDRIYGIDTMSERVDKARARGIEVYQGDLNRELPYENESFDVVHANQVIEHLHNTDILIKEAYRVLKTGGYLVISTPNLASFHNILHLLLGKQPYWANVSDEVLAGTWHLVGPAKKASARPESGPAHRRLFTKGALEELLEYYGFKIEKSIGSGFYPLPTPLAKVMSFIDSRHAAIITVKARKLPKL